jgi:guanylate kinase
MPSSAKGLVVVIVGPGGVGKGTVARSLLEQDPNLWLSRSWTTRAVRPSETGEEYFFVTREAFEQAIADDAFLEWAEFQGNLYGTPRPSLDEERDLLLEIEIQGAQQVREHDPNAVIFLLIPPSLAVLEARLRGRGDTDDHVARRLVSSEHELEVGEALADYVVTNHEVAQATQEIFSILEGLRQSRRTVS